MDSSIIQESKRNETIDIIRGIAIILVLIGHIGAVSTYGFYNSLLGNIIWSVQMPLFMMISGYCTQYSRLINSRKLFLKYLLKRSITYLLPWFVWSIIRGLLQNNVDLISYLIHIVFDMDAGYWFLPTLWMISVVFGIATWFSSFLIEKTNYRALSTLVFCTIGTGVLFGIGMIVGLNNFGIKLVVYYTPFFCLGYLFGQVIKLYSDKIWFKRAKQISILPILIVYTIIILNCDLYAAQDTVINIIYRVIASVCGCVLIISVVVYYKNSIARKIKKLLILSGTYSLELYVVHILFSSIINVTPMPKFLSVQGVEVCIINFILMVLASFICILILSSNKIIRILSFGKLNDKV